MHYLAAELNKHRKEFTIEACQLQKYSELIWDVRDFDSEESDTEIRQVMNSIEYQDFHCMLTTFDAYICMHMVVAEPRIILGGFILGTAWRFHVLYARSTLALFLTSEPKLLVNHAMSNLITMAMESVHVNITSENLCILEGYPRI